MNRNDLLTSTRNIFLRAFLDGMRDSLARSIVDLFKQADFSNSSNEQRALLDARGLLQDKHDELLVILHKFMEQLLNRSFQTTYSTFRPSFGSQEQNASLSLVDSSAFEEELRINDMTMEFRSDAEDALRDLNIRIAILFEQDTINERENPFRPYLLSRCIALSVESLNSRQEMSQLLILTLGEHLSGSVLKIYENVNNFLAQNGIAATLQYKIEKTTKKQEHSNGSGGSDFQEQLYDEEGNHAAYGNFSNSGSRSSGIFGSGGGSVGNSGSTSPMQGNPNKLEQLIATVKNTVSSATAGGNGQGSNLENFGHSWLTGGQQVGEMLRNFFSGLKFSSTSPQIDPITGDVSTPVQAAGANNDFTAINMATSSLVQAIQQMQGNFIPRPQTGMQSPGESHNLILAHRIGLNKLTQDIDEQMTIDIVAMLFEFILRDPQVPAEVRAQLGRLQFLVLKVALRDTSLLTHKSHPARVLVNRIGSISLGLQQLDSHGAGLTTEICRIVDALLEDETGDRSLFTKLLDDLDAFIAHELRSKDNKVDRAVQVAEQAENYTLRFAHTMAQMREALSGLTIDPYLRDFFENTWVRVIERVERQLFNDAPFYRLIVPDVLWSIIPKEGGEERSLLFKMLPEILNTLRTGLGEIKWGSERQQTLLNWLMVAHTNVLRSAPVENSPSLTSLREHFRQFLTANMVEDISNHRDTTSENLFLNEVIRESSSDVELIEPQSELESSTGSIPGTEAIDDGREISYSEIEDRLRNGVSLEINVSGKPSIGQLNWVSKSLSLMVLKLDGQALPSMISVKTLSRMLTHGRARFLENEPLFERAVMALLKSAEQIDDDTPEQNELTAA